MTAFELFGVLKLDRSDFDSGLKDAKKDAESFGKSVDDATNKSGGFGSKIGSVASTAAKGFGMIAKTGAVALGAATAATGAFAKSSMDAAVSYESAFTGVRKTVDATEEEYAELSDWIMDASTKMASSKETIAGTMEIAGQLGVRGVEGLEKFTETMIMLGDTTNLNSEEAASALAKFGNIAGISAEDTDRIGSSIVDLGNHYATTESDIVSMATRLASAGTIAGLSATDILGLSTAMSSVGIQAEAGGTAMAQTIKKMESAVASGAEDMTRSWEDLAASSWEDLSGLENFARVSHMSTQEFADAWKNEPIKAIEAFITGLGDLNEADESVLLVLEEMGLTGIRQSNMLQALALASDTLSSAVNTANTAYEENVALQNEANTRYGTTESQMMQAAESFKNLKVVIGQELMPTYQDFLSFSSTAMQDISKGLQEGGLEGMMSAVGTALSDGLTKVVDLIPVAIDAGSKLLSALGQGILDNLPTIADTAVQIVVKLAEGLVTALPELATGLMTFFESLKESFANNSDALLSAGKSILEMLLQGLVEGLPSMITGITEFMVGFAEWLTNPETLTPLIEGAVSILMALADGLIQALPTLIEAIPVIIQNLVTAIVDNLPMLVEAAVQLLGALAQAIIENLPLILAAAVQIVFSLINGLIETLPALVTAMVSLMSELIRVIIDSLPKFIENAIKIVGALIEGIVNMAGSLVKAGLGMITELIKGITNGAKKIVQAGKDVIAWVRDGIKQKIDDAKKWGKDLIDNFIKGIKEKAQALWKSVTDLANGIKKILGFSEPEIGPLSDFHTYAPDMVKLFAKGVEDNKDMLLGAVSDAFNFKDAIVNSPIDNIDTGYRSASAVLNSMKNDSNPNKDMTIILELDRQQFARAVYRVNNDEVQRVGLSLAGGYT